MVIPGATVKLTSPYGDHSTTTNGAGEYTFQNLVIGPGYSIEVDQPGFAPATATNLTVGINQQTSHDFTLAIGTTAKQWRSSAEASDAIDLSTTTIGANIDESLYKNVPIGRNISAVMAMAPGVADSDGAGAARILPSMALPVWRTNTSSTARTPPIRALAASALTAVSTALSATASISTSCRKSRCRPAALKRSMEKRSAAS